VGGQKLGEEGFLRTEGFGSKEIFQNEREEREREEQAGIDPHAQK